MINAAQALGTQTAAAAVPEDGGWCVVGPGYWS
jgi:hypothetical protein